MPKLPGKHLLKRIVFAMSLVALGFVLAWVRFQPQLGQVGRLTDGTRTLQTEGTEALRFAMWDRPEVFEVADADGTEQRPTSSPDGRWLVFAAGERGVAADLFVAEVIDGLSSQPRRIDELSTRFDELAPSFAPGASGGALWFASNRPGGAGGLDLYRADFREGRFGEPERLPEPLNGPWQDTDPALDARGRLAFASTRDDSGNRDYDLYIAVEGPETWGVGRLGEFESPFDERDPAFAAGGSSLLFSSDRDGDFDLYRSFESAAGWLAPEPLEPLNTPADERGPAPREDGFALLFSRSGETAPAAAGLLRATSRELYRLPSRPVGWEELLVIALLALLAFLAWAAQRWRGMDVLWRCVLISLLVHLGLLWWFQRIHPEPSPVELDPNDGRITVRLDLSPSAADRAARSERGGVLELARAESAQEQGAEAATPAAVVSAERRELESQTPTSAEALELAAPEVARAVLPAAELARQEPSERESSEANAPDLRAPAAPEQRAASEPVAARALELPSESLEGVERAEADSAAASAPTVAQRTGLEQSELATSVENASDASTPDLALAPAKREALAAAEPAGATLSNRDTQAPRATGAPALSTPAAAARRGVETAELDMAEGLASNESAERLEAQGSGPTRGEVLEQAAPDSSGPSFDAPELALAPAKREALPGAEPAGATLATRDSQSARGAEAPELSTPAAAARRGAEAAELDLAEGLASSGAGVRSASEGSTPTRGEALEQAAPGSSGPSAESPELALAAARRDALPNTESFAAAAATRRQDGQRAASAPELQGPAGAQRRGVESAEPDLVAGLLGGAPGASERSPSDSGAPTRSAQAAPSSPTTSGPAADAPELALTGGARAALPEGTPLTLAAATLPTRSAATGSGASGLEVAAPAASGATAPAREASALALNLTAPAPERSGTGATAAASGPERLAPSAPAAPTRAAASGGLALAPSFARRGLSSGAPAAPGAPLRRSTPLASVDVLAPSTGGSVGVAAPESGSDGALALAAPSALARRSGTDSAAPERSSTPAPRRALGPAVAAAAAPALDAPRERRPELAPTSGLPDLERTPYRSRTGAAKELALETGGGTEETEAAVASGLDYLASIQSSEGFWGRSTNNHVKYGYTAVGKSGLSLLAFLGAGHTPTSGTKHSETVARGIDFLLSVQGSRSGHFGDTSAYSHGIATYALAETYALSKVESYRAPLERAVERILRAQSKRDGRAYFGGWSYYYPDDHQFDRWPRTSITAWQVMALESARLAGLEVPDQAFDDATKFLKRARDNDLGAFRYSHDPEWVNGSRPTLPGSTPAALFALSLLGEDLDENRYLPARQFVSERTPDGYRDRGENSFVRDATGNLYFWYYGSLALFRIGGRQWEVWNEGLKESLLPAQNRDGSFDPISPYARDYAYDRGDDKAYSTAMAVLCLEVYYRYFTPLLQVK